MDIWSILGIPPTTDRAAIADAYHKRLPGANPEDHPEAFKALRAAYEQALQLSRQAAAPSAEQADTPAGRWTAQLDAIYQDIARRREPAAWQTLLEEDFSFALITRVQARDALLRYLTTHFFLPADVWHLLDTFFSLQADAAELCQTFPKDFIDNAILAGIRNRELLPYGKLEGAGAAQCDAYLKAYSRCHGALSALQAGAAAEALKAMRESGAAHPYTYLCEAQLAMLRGDFVEAQQQSDLALAALPEDARCLLLDGQLALHAKEYPRAEQQLRCVIEKEPDLAQAQFDLAASLCGQERYEEAKALYLKLYRAIPYNQLILEQVARCNRYLLPRREALCRAEPDNWQNRIELAWCYHQEYREADALRMIAALPVSFQGMPEYENLSSKVYLGNGDVKSALQHLTAWERAIRSALTEDKETQTRLPECLRLQAIALSQLERQPEADKLLREITAQWPEDAAAWQLMAQHALDEGELPAALQYAAQMREASPGDPYGQYLTGVVLFRMGRMQEAYNCFGAAMQRSGRDAGCLIYQVRILIGAGQWDDAQKILDDLTFAKVEAPGLDYCLARMASHNQDAKKAEELYTGLLPACRSEEDAPDFAGEVFYRLICLQYKARPKEELLALATEGLAHDAGSVSLLEWKGDLLRELNRIPEAIATYQEICRRAPGHPGAHESLGRLYQFCTFAYESAAEQYRLQLEIEDSAVVQNLLALCLQECGQYEAAEQHFQLAADMAPTDFSFRANLAELYLLTKQYARAEEAYRAALALPVKRASNRIRLRRQLARLYWRTGRSDEAAALLEENVSAEAYYEDIRKLSNGWARAGCYARAARELERWRRLAHPPEGSYCFSRANLYLMQAHPWQACAVLWFGAQRDRTCCRRLACLLAALGHDRIALPMLRRLAAAAPEDVILLENYARCLWWAGHEQEAARTARQGLDALQKHRSDYAAALYHTQEAALLLSLGDIPQAAAALSQALHSPMCPFCYHGGCKDALSIQGLLEERKKNFSAARDIFEQGRLRYPDEDDFFVYLAHLTKRMKQA